MGRRKGKEFSKQRDQHVWRLRCKSARKKDEAWEVVGAQCWRAWKPRTLTCEATAGIQQVNMHVEKPKVRLGAGQRADTFTNEKSQQSPAHSRSFLGEALTFFLRVTTFTRRGSRKAQMTWPWRLTKSKMGSCSSCALHKDATFKVRAVRTRNIFIIVDCWCLYDILYTSEMGNLYNYYDSFPGDGSNVSCFNKISVYG